MNYGLKRISQKFTIDSLLVSNDHESIVGWPDRPINSKQPTERTDPAGYQYWIKKESLLGKT